MAWVGARAFDQAGVTSFQALLAPLLIDNLELQGKVFDAGIPQEMLSGLDKLDLVGIGVLPGPMRKVLGIREPFTKPGDFAAAVVGIQDSGVADQTFHALGATAKPVPAGAKLDGLDAYEQQLASIQGNQYADDAKYVTGNLNLWPRPLVIIANRAAYDQLSADQHEIMAAAAKDGVPRRHGGRTSRRHERGTALCKAGLTFAQSSDADLNAFEKALAPVYATIRNDPANAAWLDRIAGIKQSLHRAPDGAQLLRRPSRQAAGLTLRRHLPDERRLAEGQGCGRALRRRRGGRPGRGDLRHGAREGHRPDVGPRRRSRTPNASSGWRFRTSSSRISWSSPATMAAEDRSTSPTRTAS